MKRLNIVVEGQTEQSFVNEVLAPYLRNNGVSLIIPRLIRTSKTGRGGLVNYHHLYNTIKGLLSNPHDGNIVVSSFVDFFRTASERAIETIYRTAYKQRVQKQTR